MGNKLIAQVKKNLCDYKIIEKFVAGIVLTGNEIKSVRNYQSSIDESYIFPQQQELYVLNMHIAVYKYSHTASLVQARDPKRRRKLGWAKLEIALAQRLRKYQIKEKVKEKELKRRLKNEPFYWELRVSINKLERVRSNRISVELIGSLIIEYQGEKKMIKSLASSRVSPSHELVVRAFDPKLIPLISKAILDSQLGYKVEKTTKEEVYFALLPMTTEIRERLIKNVKVITEEGKKAFRLVHQEIKNALKKVPNLSQDQKRNYERQGDKLVRDYQDKLISAEEKKVRELSS
ncbi:6938_t:CDS:2 [Ambispora leptoticha]|uniref:6938_t:CDS:1 n=1 Tax=Ambispora leptoticha TaxID=144679 RepID=A0A9N8V0S7_9GLOM|nr:6938_t:CDS:2 [Ambispora leptoticha]